MKIEWIAYTQNKRNVYKITVYLLYVYCSILVWSIMDSKQALLWCLWTNETYTTKYFTAEPHQSKFKFQHQPNNIHEFMQSFQSATMSQSVIHTPHQYS